MVDTLRGAKMTKREFSVYVSYIGQDNLSFARGYAETYARAKTFRMPGYDLTKKLECQREAVREWQAMDEEEQTKLTNLMCSFMVKL